MSSISISIIGLGNMAGALADRALAGGNARAKARVSAFIESLGLRPMDAGQLPMARALENAALLEMSLAAHPVKHTNFFLGVSILG